MRPCDLCGAGSHQTGVCEPCAEDMPGPVGANVSGAISAVQSKPLEFDNFEKRTRELLQDVRLRLGEPNLDVYGLKVYMRSENLSVSVAVGDCTEEDVELAEGDEDGHPGPCDVCGDAESRCECEAIYRAQGHY